MTTEFEAVFEKSANGKDCIRVTLSLPWTPENSSAIGRIRPLTTVVVSADADAGQISLPLDPADPYQPAPCQMEGEDDGGPCLAVFKKCHSCGSPVNNGRMHHGQYYCRSCHTKVKGGAE